MRKAMELHGTLKRHVRPRLVINNNNTPEVLRFFGKVGYRSVKRFTKEGGEKACT